MNKPRTYLNVYLSILIFAFIFVYTQICFSTTIKETFKKNITFDQGGFLSLSNSNGSIEVVSWDENEVEIIAYKEVKASDRSTAERMMKKLEIDISESEDEIIVDTIFPRSSSSGGVFGWLFGGGGQSYSVEYEIKVPRQIDLNLNTTNGNVRVEKISGKVRLESTNGKITAEEIRGIARCKTTNGSIRVELDEISNNDAMSFKTTNGSIKLYLPDDFGADAELKTTNGHIESDFHFSEKMSKSKKRYNGRINDGGAELICSTTNGNISLYKSD